MEYVYVVVKDRLNDCKTVEVYGVEELAKTRAEKLGVKYYKRPIRYDYGAMCVLDSFR